MISAAMTCSEYFGAREDFHELLGMKFTSYLPKILYQIGCRCYCLKIMLNTIEAKYRNRPATNTFFGKGINTAFSNINFLTLIR